MKNNLLKNTIFFVITSMLFLHSNILLADWDASFTTWLNGMSSSNYSSNNYFGTSSGGSYGYSPYYNGYGDYSIEGIIMASTSLEMWSEYETYNNLYIVTKEVSEGAHLDYTWNGIPGDANGASISLDIFASSCRGVRTESEISDDTTGIASVEGSSYFNAYCGASESEQVYDELGVAGHLTSRVYTYDDPRYRYSFTDAPDSYSYYLSPYNDDLYQCVTGAWTLNLTDFDYEVQSAIPAFSVYSYAEISSYCQNYIDATSSEICDTYSNQFCGIDFSSTCSVDTY